MLIAMSSKHKIQSMSEAIAASVRAERTGAAIVSLHREIDSHDINAQERIDREQEIDRLRDQYRRERKLLSAFYKTLERKGEELERILAFKDPEIERIDKELTQAYESNDRNKNSEIARLRGEFERRSKELLTANPG
jgi:hypothetical protein